MSENTQEQDASDESTETTLADALDWATTRVADEEDNFPGDMPNHAGTLLAKRAMEVLTTLTNIQTMRAHEEQEDPTDEEVREALAENAVDIFLGLGALQYEYDLDIADAFEARQEQIEMFEEADSMEELIEAVMASQNLDKDDLPMPIPMQPGGEEGADMHDPDDPDHHIQ